MRILGYLISAIFMRIKEIDYKKLIKKKPKKLTDNDLFIKDIIININKIDISTYRSFTYKNINFYIEEDNSLLYRYIDHSRLCCPSTLVKELRKKIKEIIDVEKS